MSVQTQTAPTGTQEGAGTLNQGVSQGTQDGPHQNTKTKETEDNKGPDCREGAKLGGRAQRVLSRKTKMRNKNSGRKKKLPLNFC